jgi:hypothetical protein
MNSYNENKEYFHAAVLSVLNQKGVDIQLILSTVKNDPCIEWSKNYKNIELIINDKPGIFEQINATIDKIKGEYITYSSSNDEMLENKCKIESELLYKNNKKVCYSAYFVTDENLKITKTNKFREYDYDSHLKGNYVSDCAMVDYKIFKKYTPFILKYKNMAYYDLWLRIFEGEGNVFFYNDIPTWKYRITKNSQHIKRQSNDVAKKINENLRFIMLNDHKNKK